ncbi:zinc-dependent alcohol dehydrogenase [Saccharopolyspora mangrovi]|uniref:Alcohol dehydrogenase catalytic domain-containing protein n=1 Tax=Saccharopolyspora mangrovi TaxID=3082379 RepID=A0ABU6AI87_9PSEU|nr:alcohol dehydrogenase catalytic domain-containing protein [Saccharopolyspora sp. S2-29]MEB3371276.1 alcohol dehydrogenase catalytic domain-containing protein [Saccharopolyspora sp. S2-29]
MKAVILSEDRNIDLQDRDITEPGPGEVLLRSEYCGICGTDLHAPDLDLFKPPVVMGHEFSAEIIATGPGVAGWAPGMRVVANPNGNACQNCDQCRGGRVNLCRVATMAEALGVCRDGGMAEQVVVPAVHLHRLPDTLDSLRGAWTEPLAVAVRAVAHSGLRLGEEVLVIGGGPIGQLVVQLARRAGARKVTLIEPSPMRRGIAHRLGADHVFEPGEHAGAVSGGQLRPVERVFECSGHPTAVQTAIDAIAPGGSIQLVAISPQPVTFDAMSALTKEIQLNSKFIYVEEFDLAIDLLARDLVDVMSLTSSVVELDDYATAFDALNHPDSTVKALLRTGATG